MKKSFLITALGLTMVLCWMGTDSAWAKYPEKKIRLIVPFAPGGGADIMARALYKYANVHLGGRLYVENIAGASGAIGWREAAKADPDGYTLCMMVTTLMTAPHITRDFPTYDLFDVIGVTARDPGMFSVKSDSRFKNIQELIAFAKANPGKLVVSTAGVGAIDHLYISAFAKSIDAEFTYVPYKGAGPAVVAAAGGHADAVGSGYSEAFNLLKGKKLRPVVVFTSKRFADYPDIPTAAEIGHEMVVYHWRAVGAPRGIPSEVKGVLVEAFGEAVRNPEFQKMVRDMGLEPNFLGPDEAAPFLKEQNDFFTGIARKIGLEPK
jgi:tripartite-type tricarboxylate transporter receptor subunit TctC